MTPRLFWVLLLLFRTSITLAQQIPLPEHPRPDFERSEWLNLNGKWAFAYDSLDVGLTQEWYKGATPFPLQINVPFPWGSPLSGVEDRADIAWYQRTVTVDPAWNGKRTFLTIGASDWETSVWLDGHFLGKHRGGYTPFSFELTPHLKAGAAQKLVVRVDDKRRDFTLYGKQGYGNARGIWQTVYLEARGKTYFESVHFTPDIDQKRVRVEATFGEQLPQNETVRIEINTPGGPIRAEFTASKGSDKSHTYVAIPNPRLWTLTDPYLYTAKVQGASDQLTSYFGMRKISVVNLPGTDIPYISLNNEPIYLQLTLDQSYHPEGYYTFPTDEFMKNEIQLCKNIGLNGLRTHIKVDIPRKLYWADKLGLLVMADLPNFWGEPTPEAQQESEYALRQMIKRDYNHPAIFSWIVFNETWGLRTKVKNETTQKEESLYLPHTQYWVASMYYLAKSLDNSRLVEDNSICCGAGHTETDINSWHEYLPGYAWEAYMANLDRNTFVGSTFHFEKGFVQGNQPMINSECGNVWGYEGSTGDVDWSYDYHRMMNVFRKYPKMAGWLYTEHHDVINEWNGYWRFDRSMKYTGLDEIAPGMTDRDFHSLVYLSTGQDITQTVQAGSQASVPLFVSVMQPLAIPDKQLQISYSLEGMTQLGDKVQVSKGSQELVFEPWMQRALSPLSLKMPEQNGLYTLVLKLQDSKGTVYHTNFMSFDVVGGVLPSGVQLLSKKPTEYTSADWSLKTWAAMEGRKANGAGKGQFTYRFEGSVNNPKSGYLLLELGAKELFYKDREGSEIKNTDYMLGARAQPSQNKNAYPMTDEALFGSSVTIKINGQKAKTVALPDDPADHRGILSWHYQKQNRRLDEAGSYGYLVKIPLTKGQLNTLAKDGKLDVQLLVEGEGGLAVYGREFGRYPFDPSLVLKR